MPRVSTIKTHKKVDAIEQDIVRGVPAVEIARKYGVSESALARHKSNRLNALASAMKDDTPSTTDVLGRVADLVDSATRSRKLADAGSTASTRARAQTVELAALNTLLDRLGVDDLTTLRTAQGAGLAMSAIRQLVVEHPDLLPDALRILRAQHSDFEDVADALAEAMKKRNRV